MGASAAGTEPSQPSKASRGHARRSPAERWQSRCREIGAISLSEPRGLKRRESSCAFFSEQPWCKSEFLILRCMQPSFDKEGSTTRLYRDNDAFRPEVEVCL